MQDKKTLITICILLAVFLPLSIIGTYKHFTIPKEEEIVDDNPNKDLIYNGNVYFYLNNKLLQKIACNNCKKAESTIDDDKYHTNSYRFGNSDIEPVINNNLGIINNNGVYQLYSLVNGGLMNYYDEIKTYKVPSSNNYLINKKANKWGVVYLDFSSSPINNDYDYIAIPSHFKNDLLDTSKFIAKKGLLWYILNPDGTATHPAVRGEITDFNDNYYVLYENGYHIMDYDNNEYLEGVSKDSVYGVGKYIFIISNINQLYIYENCSNTYLKRVELPSYESIYFSSNEDGIAIMIDGNKYETLVIP